MRCVDMYLPRANNSETTLESPKERIPRAFGIRPEHCAGNLIAWHESRRIAEAFGQPFPNLFGSLVFPLLHSSYLTLTSDFAVPGIQTDTFVGWCLL